MLQATGRKSRVITEVRREQGALYLRSDYGLLKISPKSETIIHIIFTGKAEVVYDLCAGVIYDDQFNDWDYTESSDAVTVQTGALHVTVVKATGSVSYSGTDGTLIMSERAFESKIIDEYDSFKVIEDENTQAEDVETADGVKKIIKTASKVFDKKLCRTRLHLDFQAGESLSGLGQFPEGTVSLRGTTQYLHQANMKIVIPFLISSNGYGILLATDGPAVFHDNDYGSYIQTEADIQMSYYFIAGVNHDDIVKGYRKLTGKAAMLPKWVFGYIQSQERYETADELISIVKEYRRRGIGLDCIVLDWLSWEDGQWGQKTFDAKRFPDPAAMMNELHRLNARMMISVWPAMNESCNNYAQFKEKGLFFPYSNIYNAFDEEGRELYWKQADEGLFAHGIDAWWCDSSEPFTPEWVMTEEPEPSMLYHEYMRETGNFMPPEVSNAYSLFHARGIYEGQRKSCTKKRVTNLTRSAWTGQQKYGTILWSGDISADWNTLRKQISAGLHLCACGLPYWTLDIGAFFVKRGTPWYWNGSYELGTEDLGYRELYVRWFQFGAFLPIFRAHGTDIRREVWSFGKPGEPFYDALCQAVELRYQLMAYIYSLAGAAWLDDKSIIKFLHLEFPDDKNTAHIGDQYMFGPSVMVCPVTHPMLYNTGSQFINGAPFTRRVYLPAGTRWYDFRTNKVYEGGTWMDARADISHIPVFIREGSILPVLQPMMYTDEKPDAPVTLRIYPGTDGQFRFYDDDGDGYEYENGQYRLIEFRWNDKDKMLSRNIFHDHPGLKKQIPEFIEKVIK